MFKTVDRLFAALDRPEYYGREDGKGNDYDRPYICPELQGIGLGPASITDGEKPLSMVEAWEAHAQHETMMTRAQREAEGQRMDARRNALEAAATLAPQITDDELKAILEEIENVNSTDHHNDSPRAD